MLRNKVHTEIKPSYGMKLLLSDISQLIKFRLTLLVVFSSLMAYLIVMSGAFDIRAFLYLAVGGFLITSAANVLNEMLEKKEDAIMARTKNRPIATGRLSTTNAMIIAGIMILLGVLVLTLISPLTALLSITSLVIYAFIYTPSKKYSPISITIGAIPGAMPMLIGCVAAQGELTLMALVLFGIQFLWQFPHFLAIAYLGAEDYIKAGFNNVPLKDGKVDRQIGLHATIYSIVLLCLCIVPYFLGFVNKIGIVLALFLSLLYVVSSVNFYYKFNRKSAMIMMFSSFAYLPLILYVFWQFKNFVL